MTEGHSSELEPRLTLTVGFGTDRGLRRELNEDSFLAQDPVFMVADGMGGHEAGEVASQLAVDTLREAPELEPGTHSASAQDIQQIIERADWRIREATGARAGTTLTGAVLIEISSVPYWLVANVGDSRTYRLSAQGQLDQISVDHSEVRELVDAGEITPEEALVHPRRHVVTRALGTGEDAEADFWLLPVEDGDRLLICSDGLTSELRDGEIHCVLMTRQHPQDAVEALIDAAIKAGGRDNVTVIVVDVRDTASELGLPETAPRLAPGQDTRDRDADCAGPATDAGPAIEHGPDEGATDDGA
ncbi:PP2C family serine/threonine-protein phosphatase [Sinomonas sp. R1AF57]|uniref:PP2C family protein-serine/threonine phosphatase n=1 Tax=Sinomonas sp. R1AF57 TaxID=2020377 RepID=UPI000B615EAE|nr:protein phosphatase 2C domain-containing protein [Sinomonas sp. R1AF57]ASN51529.1 serine/threonine protein phosphatase [Sinomonas sp. R1AF57]